MVNDNGDGINVVPHNDRPRNVFIFNNTITASGKGIRLVGAHQGYRQEVIGNAVFSDAIFLKSYSRNNFFSGYDTAHNFLKNPKGKLGKLDLSPQPMKLRKRKIDSHLLSYFTDWDIDFNGSKRNGAFMGAYANDNTNYDWKLKIGKKYFQRR